jgi:DNA-binding winged helix-turn-helix (wHTH) protein
MLSLPELRCSMPQAHANSSTKVRFGPFEANLLTQELWNSGKRIRVPAQSFQVLQALLNHPGDLVTREQLHSLLWPSDTFVDFEHGLNATVNRLRDALHDSADRPRWIETLPRRGYRFIGAIAPPITTAEPRSASPAIAMAPPVETHQPLASGGTRSRMVAFVLALTTCVLLGVFVYAKWWRRPEFPSVTAVPFTALPGWAGSPAFSSDGSRIAFAWTGDSASDANGVDLYVKNIGTEKLLRLTNHPADWISLAWSPDGTQIAFHRLSKGESAIYVISARGGPEKKYARHMGPLTPYPSVGLPMADRSPSRIRPFRGDAIDSTSFRSKRWKARRSNTMKNARRKYFLPSPTTAGSWLTRVSLLRATSVCPSPIPPVALPP